MSILDLDNNLDNSLDLELYYTNKIINFFKKNGTMGHGILSTFKVNSELLFKWVSLENLLANPSEYVLYSTRAESILRSIYKNEELTQGSFLEDVISRKIQILPNIMLEMQGK